MGDAQLRDVATPPLAVDVGSLVVLAQRFRDGAVTAAGRLTFTTYLPAGK